MTIIRLLLLKQGTCANCDNVIRSTPLKYESSSGTKHELCTNECLLAWSKSAKGTANGDVKDEEAPSLSPPAGDPPVTPHGPGALLGGGDHAAGKRGELSLAPRSGDEGRNEQP